MVDQQRLAGLQVALLDGAAGVLGGLAAGGILGGIGSLLSGDDD